MSLQMGILCISVLTYSLTFYIWSSKQKPQLILFMDISVQELKERIDQGDAPIMIDVREPHEWEMQHLEGVQKISLGTLPYKIQDIEEIRDKEVVMICRSGGRSGRATQFLAQQGFTKVRNLTGGMLAWKANIDSDFNVE